jgi:hypothetical protein
MFFWRRKFWSGRFEGHVFVRIGNYRLNYRAENLKLRLTKYYGDKLQFIDMTKPGTYSWNLVFNAKTDIKSMGRHVYKHWQIRWYSKVPTYWNQQGVRQWQTAIAMAVENTSTFLSPQIVRHPDEPFVFHSDFDNNDQLLNEFCGMVSVHTSHGIIRQDFDCPKGPSWPWLYGSWIYNYLCEVHNIMW